MINSFSFGQSIALDSTGNPYVTGSTSSNNFPAIAGTYRAYQSSLSGVAGNAFVAKIDAANAPGGSIVPATIVFGNQTESVRRPVNTVTVTNEGTAPLTISQITFAETDSTGNTVAKRASAVVQTPAGPTLAHYRRRVSAPSLR